MNSLRKLSGIIFSLILFSLSPGLAGREVCQFPDEMVFVHTDRDVYIAGEELFFSAYVYDRGTGYYSDGSKVVYIEILNKHNTSIARARLIVENGIAIGILRLPDTLTSGDYLLRAYTNYMKNRGPEYFFTSRLVIFNPFTELPSSKPDESDSVAVMVTHQSNRPLESTDNSFVSVTMDESFSTRQRAVMEIHIDTSAFSFNDLSNISVSVSLSSGLNRNQGFADFLSVPARVLEIENASESVALSFPIEDQGPFLSGSLISRESFDPVAGVMLYLSIPGKIPLFQYAISDDKGDFRFLLFGYEEGAEMIIQQADFSDRSIIKINSPYSDQYVSFETVLPEWNGDFLKWLSRIGVNYQINRIFHDNDPPAEYLTKEFKPPLRFYGVPDRELVMADYVTLPTMDEVFHELVPGVSFRRQRTGYRFSITNETTGETIGVPGAVLLDGVILGDHSLISSIDPELIERIDVIRGDYQVGSKVFSGIISIISYKGDMCGLGDQVNGARASFVPDRSVIPGNLTYNEDRHSDARTPDFRNTLFWAAGLHPDSSGYIRIEFFTSDFKSEYDVVIEGLTDKGIPISVRRKIAVGIF